MMNKRAWYSIFIILIVVAVVLWLAVLMRPDSRLKIVTCDVGQGEAILVIKENFQMLVDGGPNNKVVSCVDRHIPFWDREIEIMVSTHPDSDHYTGLVEVLKRRKIGIIVATEANKEGASYREFVNLALSEGAGIVMARSGQRIRYSNLYIDILSPSADAFVRDSNVGVNHTTLGSYNIDEKLSNDYSIVMLLNYYSFDALLTGDLSPVITEELSRKGMLRDVNYLSVPHHGSRNGLTRILLQKTTPELAVISAGKGNRYGHPHREVVDLLNEFGVKTYGTYENGELFLSTNGDSFSIQARHKIGINDN